MRRANIWIPVGKLGWGLRGGVGEFQGRFMNMQTGLQPTRHDVCLQAASLAQVNKQSITWISFRGAWLGEMFAG
jgi:hypothetical protein